MRPPIFCGADERVASLLSSGADLLSSVLRRISHMAVRIEKDGPVWTVIHDRPEARNAMDPKSADALTAAFLEFDADKHACVAVLHGAGGAFCAGAGISNTSARSMPTVRWASSISRRLGHMAM